MFTAPIKFVKENVNSNRNIFEDHYKRGKPLPVVKPGTQTRRFTHIDDTVNICYLAWKKNFVDIIVLQIKNLILF